MPLCVYGHSRFFLCCLEEEWKIHYSLVGKVSPSLLFFKSLGDECDISRNAEEGMPARKAEMRKDYSKMRMRFLIYSSGEKFVAFRIFKNFVAAEGPVLSSCIPKIPTH